MELKITEEYYLDVCEFCGKTADRHQKYEKCACCKRSFCPDCQGQHVVGNTTKEGKEPDTYICKVCTMHGAEVYAFEGLSKCKLHFERGS